MRVPSHRGLPHPVSGESQVFTQGAFYSSRHRGRPTRSAEAPAVRLPIEQFILQSMPGFLACLADLLTMPSTPVEKLVENVLRTVWLHDPAAAPPQAVQTLLLFGSEGLSQTSSAPSNSVSERSRNLGSNVRDHHSDRAGHRTAISWSCPKCTLFNDNARRKCEICLTVDPARPIKRIRRI